MDLNTLLNFFETGNLASIGLKLFGILFSIFLLFFSLLIIKQVQVMRKTVLIDRTEFLLIFAIIQFLLSLVLVFYSVFVL